jgi:hypothetical protein
VALSRCAAGVGGRTAFHEQPASGKVSTTHKPNDLCKRIVLFLSPISQPGNYMLINEQNLQQKRACPGFFFSVA